MANAALFIGGGLLAGVGHAGLQFALEEARSNRDLMLRKVDQEFRSGESQKTRDFAAEQDRIKAEREGGYLSGSPVQDEQGNLTGFTKAGNAIDLGVKGDTSARDLRKAQASWYEKGRPGLIKAMSEDQRKDLVRKAAQAEVKGDKSLIEGDERDKAMNKAMKRWSKFYGVEFDDTPPPEPPKPAVKPNFFERNFGGGSSSAPAAPAAQPAPPAPPAPSAQPAPQAPQIKPSVNVLPGSQGTQQNPYKPTTANDLQNLPAGVIYMNPADGKLYRKK